MKSGRDHFYTFIKLFAKWIAIIVGIPFAIILILVGYLWLIMILFFSIPENITRTYPLTESRTLIVDTADCGATCGFQLCVYIKDKKWFYTAKEDVFCCADMFDIEFTDVTPTRAKISNLDNNANSLRYGSCKSIKIGDYIDY